MYATYGTGMGRLTLNPKLANYRKYFTGHPIAGQDMRILRVTSIALVLTLLALRPQTAQGSGPRKTLNQGADPPGGVRYEPARLPMSARSARTWVTLRETMVKPPPDGTPFAEVLRTLQEATRGKGEKEARLKVYVDPTSLKEAEISLSTPIASPFVGQDEVPLHTYLGFILKPFGLTHRVHDGLVVIDTPCDECPGPVEVSASEAWTWLLLHEEILLRFPEETPLGDVIKAMQRGTVGKGPGGRGLVVHLDPAGLREAGKAADSPVTIEMERVPLCTSLGLVLKQLGLGFSVRDDGVLVVTHFTVAEDDLLMDEAEAIEGYQLLRYDLFWESRKQPFEERQRRPPGAKGTR